jgi:hypothetical protein
MVTKDQVVSKINDIVKDIAARQGVGGLNDLDSGTLDQIVEKLLACKKWMSWVQW